MRSDIETAPRETIRETQSERLRETVEHAYENVPFYRQALDDAGVAPDDIDRVGDVSKLPTTTKEDFRMEYPDGLFAVDWDDVARIHASSGTTGKPKIVSYTDDDLAVWSEVVARSLVAGGVDSDDVVQNSYGYGLFTGGLGLHAGAEEVGATVIPTGGGDTARQMTMLQDLESDVLCCTPSYCLYIAEALEDAGVNPAELPLSTVIIGAEPFTDAMREEIEDALDVTALDIYGLSEIIGPGVSMECADAQAGLHIWEDHFLPEVVDPETGEPLPEGEEGELVLTTLTKQALPVLRYRTGDMTALTYEACDCGRSIVRMDNVTGRTDDLLIVRGVNVYPSQIEEVMVDLEAVAPHYRIDLRRDDELDRLEITAEHHHEYDGSLEDLADDIGATLRDVLDVSPDSIEVVGPSELERTEVGKVKRVFDHR
ncbi:phenylacetate--CoA ligase PaaK [Halolamina sp.]|jgi:phenylacetate-CoA ligase|uniref:phenylacetate--CoA ligase PaaK n=1 Tax=Halolamina sp. TaxID=1940283 RepID=UPI000223BBC6|nr:Phenylacetate--CoA ligase [halophilic archaeon DL31]